MAAPSSFSAHVDTFAADHLPRADQQPGFRWDHADLAYPSRLNCGVELLDSMVAAGRGPFPCLRDAHGRSWTYAEVLDRANRVANVLVARGLVPGNRVLLRGPNSPWLAVCWLAVQKAGLVAVATMPMLRAGELRVILGRAQVNLSLCDVRYLDELVVASDAPIIAFGDHSELDRASATVSGNFRNSDTAADDVSLIAFTSGTTGQPKGCVHLHRDVLAIADTFSKHVLRPSADDVFIGSPPLAFTFGLGGLLIFPLRVGASVVLLESAPPLALLNAVGEHRATILFTAPTAYRQLLDSLDGVDVSTLREAVSAGEALPLATRIAFREATGIQLIDALGATEMLHVFISSRGNDVRDGAVGKPIPGFAARIVDANGNDLPDGETGRLAVQGPTGCRYLDDDRQATYVQNGWNFPGDSMWRDADGYFWYAARADDMIISSGYNIAGPEVEAALLTHPAVLECACVGVPDHDRGMVVKAYVVLRSGIDGTPEMAVALQDHVKQTIAPYKYPRRIEFRSELPKTATGKLQRFKLRAEATSP